jgi:60 kDa SS-A/Ro ribonucleoprotein
MATLNKPNRWTDETYEGATASRITPEQQLRRSVMACMLWENTFYEDGESIANRIKATIPLVPPSVVAQIAIEARGKMKLRHVPLLLARELAALRYPVASLLRDIIQRPDELTEFLAIYWKDGRQPLSAQVKKGLAAAFEKFSPYQLAKYNRDGAIKLRDVLFLCHAKPKDKEHESTWKQLIDGSLPVPDTWEVALSSGANKKETWERLLKENKLGGLALLRNLRNMNAVSVDERLVLDSIASMKTDRILPFRFISAAKYAPQWEPEIEAAMLKCLEGHDKLVGKTALLIDGSMSMFGAPVSSRSEIDRFEAATALAILAREVCEQCSITVFSHHAFSVPARRGFALRDAILQVAEHGYTYTQNGIMKAAERGYDRIIIFTDEQSHQNIHNPLIESKGYVVNVASYKNGIGYDKWTHIDGFSEAIIDYIIQYEIGDKQC